ncbi:Nucleolar protein 58 [Orbilia ellipsospora]|uniref:Nucleolar protein 58 n=1 Tax=Orbilia ellipsospora TaxID=2528407 RepID=A0AAV9XB85_9PEZI
MSAISFNFSVIIIPAAHDENASLDFPTVNQSLSFGLEISTPSDFQTLYSEDSQGADTLKGLLYVPDLPLDDPCNNLQLVPQNATRKEDLPLEDLKLVAYAPLTTPHCSRRYLYSAGGDNVAAFIFYGVPEKYSNNTDPLDDVDFPFEYPVYYLDGAIGQPLMNKLAQYSGNLTQVYDGHNLTDAGYNVHDFARIYAVISTKGTNPMPGLWLFLLVVVAVLLFIIGASSLLMHLFQFHYRRILRRRIANGEVDLEGLGIGRITVPREFLAKFPVYVYISESAVPQPAQDPRVPQPAAVVSKESAEPTVASTAEPASSSQQTQEMTETSVSKPLTLPTSAQPTVHGAPQALALPPPPPSLPYMARGYHQTTCPICLDDFIHQETTVRELPCLHIFHPECIDPYLEAQSSLCVLCKQSCLPKGYVPIRLTNAIVRRERLMRRVRERSRANLGSSTSLTTTNIEASGGILWRWRLRRLRRQEEDELGREALSRASMRPTGGGVDGTIGVYDSGLYDSRRYIGPAGFGQREDEGASGGSGSGSAGHQREGVGDDSVRPRWRATMNRIFPGFR